MSLGTVGPSNERAHVLYAGFQPSVGAERGGTLSNQAKPMIQLDDLDAANAPSLSYDVPDPTSYPGRSYISLDFGELDPFNAQPVIKGSGGKPTDSVPQALREQGDPTRREHSDSVPQEERISGAMALSVTGAITDTGSTVASQVLLRPGIAMGSDPVFRPPGPLAAVLIESPAEGTQIEGGPDGFTLTITARVLFINTPVRPDNATITVNGLKVIASPTGDPSAGVRDYTASTLVKPGPVTITARVTVSGKNFETISARQLFVKVAPTQTDSAPKEDSSAPDLAVESPASGTSFTLGSGGIATVQIRGTVTDLETPVEAVELILDGASLTRVNVSEGKFAHDVTLSELGVHEVVVTAKNALGLTSYLARQFKITDAPRIPRHRLMIVECLRLSNFLGRYGAGRIVQTFTLLPGEKTSITIRTFNTTAASSIESSSIFDSFSETTGDELTTAITSEDTTKSQSEEELKSHVNVKAGATWGWGSASVEAGIAYGTSSAREQLTKNVTNGASKHAADKSSKRDVKVDSTKTVNTTNENEETIIRTLENISHAHTLNFTFRQMTQEFVSLLHLVDIRVAHLTEWFEMDGSKSMITPDPTKPETRTPRIDYEEVALPQVTPLLQRICASPESAEVAGAIILRQLDAVFDYRGELCRIVEEVAHEVPSRDPVSGRIRTQEDPLNPGESVPVTETLTWTRFDPNLCESYPGESGPGQFTVTVPGVILGATTNSLRTDGIVVDCFLGGGNALDSYGKQLQQALARTRVAEALHAENEANKLSVGLGIVNAAIPEERAKTFAEIFRVTYASNDQKPV